MQMTQEILEEMKNADSKSVDFNNLKDIRDVKIDTSLPKDQRMLSFIEQIGNPYLYKCGDVTVKVSFTDTNVTLEDKLISYFKSLV